MLHQDALRPLVAILAGGSSRRFGRPKELAMLGGRRMVEYPAAAARDAQLPARLVGGDPGLADLAGLTHVPDAAGLEGPVAGLVAALRVGVQESRYGVILLGADMPLFPGELLSVIAREAAREPSDALAVRSRDKRLQTLGAYYPTARLERIVQASEGPHVSLTAAFEAASGRMLATSDECLRGFDLDRAFWNVNTPEDLDHVRDLLGGDGSA